MNSRFFFFPQAVYTPKDLKKQVYQGNANGSQKYQGMKGISLQSIVEERAPGYQYEKGKGDGPENYHGRQDIAHSFYMEIIENQGDQIKCSDKDHILPHVRISKSSTFSRHRSQGYP